MICNSDQYHERRCIILTNALQQCVCEIRLICFMAANSVQGNITSIFLYLFFHSYSLLKQCEQVLLLRITIQYD